MALGGSARTVYPKRRVNRPQERRREAVHLSALAISAPFEPCERYGAALTLAASSSSVRSSARRVPGAPCPGTTIAASG